MSKERFEIRNGRLFRYNGTEETVVIPEEVTMIETNAFASNRTVKTVVFPKDLYHIGLGAFVNCTALETVDLPDGLRVIGKRVFGGCRSLKHIGFSEKLAAKIGVPALRAALISDAQTENFLLGCEFNEEYRALIAEWLSGAAVIRKLVAEYIKSHRYDLLSALLVFQRKLSLDEIDALIGGVDEKNRELAVLLNNFRAERFSPDYIEEKETEDAEKLFGLRKMTVADWKKRFSFSVSQGKAVIKKYLGDEKIVIVPEKIGRASVTGIGKDAFFASEVEKVVLPSTLETIGDHAFASSSLQEIVMREGLLSLESCAFVRTKLRRVVIPSTVTRIADCVFNGCAVLEEVRMDPSSETEIAAFAFAWCRSLRKAELPGRMKIIDDGLFQSCTSLEKIRFPSNVSVIRKFAFKNCASLETVVLPSSVTRICDRAFAECTALKTVGLPEGLKRIERLCFARTALTEAVLPDGVTDVPEEAFSCCRSLTRFIAGKQTKHVGAGAFSYCEKLKEAVFPDTLEHIETSAFAYCSSLGDLRFPYAAAQYEADVFIGCSSLADKNGFIVFGPVLCGYVGKSEKITTPDGIETIVPGVFAGCRYLTEAEISSGVSVIGEKAFADCVSLASVLLPDTLNEIGAEAFSGCPTLTVLRIPYSVRHIYGRAFGGCSALTRVSIPNRRTVIAPGAFERTDLLVMEVPENSRAEHYADKNNIKKERFFA